MDIKVFVSFAARPIGASPHMTIHIRGTAALVVAAATVAATAIWLPAYRWFLLISIGIGAAVAVGFISGTKCGQSKKTM